MATKEVLKKENVSVEEHQAEEFDDTVFDGLDSMDD